jgi:hypothetical protein
MSRLLVHVGPTLPAAEVTRIAPAAEIHPPAEGGMLGRTQPHAGDVIVLIDGCYRDRPSVRHKEIMYLMGRGVTVVGAASMGALRAAELDRHGMIGVGQVYRMYSGGQLDGDDEVAIRHRTAEQGYRADSVALVNLRFAGERAVADGVVSPATAAAVLTAAKSLAFDERTWPRISAAAAGLAAARPAEVAALERYCRDRDCDLKARDARLALEYARRLLSGPRPAAARTAAAAGPAPWRTVYLRQWVRQWDFEVAPDGERVCDDDILDAARLYWPGYPGFHQEVLSELLAELTGGADPRELLGLTDAAPLPARFRPLLSGAETRSPTADQARLVLIRSWHTASCRDWRPLAVARLKAGPDWAAWRERVLAADAARAARAGEVPAHVGALLFLRRWGTSGPAATVELARRGFPSLTALDEAARRFAAQEYPASWS